MDILTTFDATTQVINSTLHSLAGVVWVLIPLAGITWLLVAGLSEERTKRQQQEHLHQERMIALEKGTSEALERAIAADLAPRSRNPMGLLVAGILVLGAGVGLTLFMGLAVDGADRNKAIAVGLIPTCVGIALIAAWVVVRRLSEGVEGGASGRG